MANNKSVEKAIKILELISKYPEGITLSKIHKTLNLPKASCYDILQALYNEDAIYFKDPVLKNYVIGSKIFAIGEAYTKNSNFINYSSPLLKVYADSYSLTTFACKRLDNKLVYIYKYESPNAKITTTDIGVQQPLHMSIAGKVMLAFLQDDLKEKLLNEILNQEYGGIESLPYKKLLKDLEKIKALGYGIDDGETSSYILSSAFPVFDFEKKASGVIMFSSIIDSKNERNLEIQISEFKDIAMSISKKQGFKGE